MIWEPDAKNDLARSWLSGRDRYRINEAVVRLDQALEITPSNAGESRSGNLRIIVIDPPVRRFRVDAANELVYVEAVWRTR